MHNKVNIFRLDHWMLAMGLSIALASGAVKAQTNAPQAEQGSKVVAVPSSSNSPQVTYTVVLPTGGTSMRLLFQPATDNRGMASSGSSSGGFVRTVQLVVAP